MLAILISPLNVTHANAAEPAWTGDSWPIQEMDTNFLVANNHLYGDNEDDSPGNMFEGLFFFGGKYLNLPFPVTPGIYSVGNTITGRAFKPVYTDQNGFPYRSGKKLSSTITFAPNSVYMEIRISDSEGKIHNAETDDLPLIKNAPTIQPNRSVGTTIVDTNGHLWMLNANGAIDRTATFTQYSSDGLQPDQYDQRLKNMNDLNWFFTNSKGELHAAGVNRKLPVKGLPARMVYPDNITIVDGNHNLWMCSLSGNDSTPCVQITTNRNLTPGIWDASIVKDGTIYASDANGTVWSYLLQSSTWMQITKFKTTPNQIKSVVSQNINGLSSSYAYITADDGTIWQTNGWDINSVPTPFVSGTAGNGGGSSCVVQMPTTGAPAGWILMSLTAMGVGLLGLCLSLLRRRI